MYFRHQRKNAVDNSALVRKLRLEALEDRRMLAVMLVTDLGDGSLVSLAGDGELSLREAVEAINTGAPVDGIGPASGDFGTNDAIVFSSSLFGGIPQTLALSAGQLELASGVTLSGPVGNLLTIDAQQNSRIFDIAASSDNYFFTQLTLTGGLTTGLDDQGGAIRSMSSGELFVGNSVVEANATTGNFSSGGAISAMGSVEFVDSSFTDNHTEGTSSGGGGVFAFGDIILTRSTVADNRTEGDFASGAGVSSGGVVTLNSSTVSGNHAIGIGSAAGGILAIGNVNLTESTISGNQTAGDTASGGGVSSEGTITVTRSTIVDNHVLGANATGGGVRTSTTDILVSGSIIANNTAGAGNADIQPGTGTLTVEHSLVGDATGLGIPAATNLLNVDPRLGPLSGGGQTKTHAPLPRSPVIDAGDELIVIPPANDQRGAGFSRIADGDDSRAAVIDMGSHEVQQLAVADFDGDNDIDGADFLAWQLGFGLTVAATPADGNSDEDADVDNQDLAVWKVQYGIDELFELSALQPQVTALAAEHDNLADLAIAFEISKFAERDADLVELTQPTFESESSSHAQAFAAIATAETFAAGELEDLASPRTSQNAMADVGELEDELIDSSI